MSAPSITAIERRNKWLLAHPEVGYMPTQQEIDEWYEGGAVHPASFRGGQGRSAGEVRDCGASVAWALIAAFFLLVGFFAGRLL